MTITIASASVFSTSTIESCTTVVVSTAIKPFSPGGNDLYSSARTWPCSALVHVQRSTAGMSKAAARRHRPRVAGGECCRRNVGWCCRSPHPAPRDLHLSAEQSRPHSAAPSRRRSRRRAWRIRLQNDVLELARIGHSSNHPHGHLVRLVRIGRRNPKLPGGHLDILLRQRVGYVQRRQAARCQLVGSSQMRMAYLRSPKMMTAPTPGTRFSASETYIQVVRNKRRRQRMVGRDKSRRQHKVAVRLGDRDAGIVHRGREPALRGSHAVLHIHAAMSRSYPVWNVIVIVEVPSFADVDDMYRMPSTPLIACSKDDRDRRLHVLRVRAYIVAAHHHLRGRQLRIQRNWNRRQRHRARKHNQQRADRGKNRTTDEKLNHETLPFLSRSQDKPSACHIYFRLQVKICSEN